MCKVTQWCHVEDTKVADNATSEKAEAEIKERKADNIEGNYKIPDRLKNWSSGFEEIHDKLLWLCCLAISGSFCIGKLNVYILDSDS